MKDFPPRKLEVPSDGNVLTFVEMLPKGRAHKENVYVYVYTVSETRSGTTLPLPESELKKNIESGIFRLPE